jgi:hypothetical protein
VRESGAHGQAASLSHVPCRIYHFSRRMLQPRYLIVGPICPRRMEMMNREQMEQGGCNAKVEAERLPSPSFWKSFTRPLQELFNNSRQESRVCLQRPTCLHGFPCLRTHHAVHTARKGSLWVSVFAQPREARGKERSLGRQTRISHPKNDTPPPEDLPPCHLILCCNWKQPRTLAHMSSADSQQTNLASSGDLVMRGSARMSALAPRYLRMRKHSALYLACSAYVQI